MNPWLAIGLVASSFAVSMAILTRLRQRGLHPELCRKSLHILMGLLAMSFPWLFHENWPVLLLAVGVVLALAALRYLRGSRTGPGNVLGGVERRSWGEFYFVISVYVLFTLSAHQPVFYLIALLILTAADAMAAIGGVFFGTRPYTTSDGSKTWEGTLWFFMVAFVCTWVPLISLEVLEWQHATLSALCVATLGAMIEAGAWQGLDNLLLPLSVLAMLRIYANRQVEELWWRIGMLAGLGAAFWILRRHVLLREGPLLGGLVIVYLCWAFGGWKWMVGPLVLLAAHPFFRTDQVGPTPVIRQAHPALLSAGLPALAWLFLARIGGQPAWLAAFDVTLASQLGMSASVLMRGQEIVHDNLRTCLAGMMGWAGIMGPGWWLQGASLDAAIYAAAALPLVIGVVFLLRALLRRSAAQPAGAIYWWERAVLASIASLILASVPIS